MLLGPNLYAIMLVEASKKKGFDIMKKLMVALSLVLLLMTSGCGKETKDLDLNKIGEAVDTLESKEFARVSAASLLDEDIPDLKEVYSTSFKKNFKITEDYVEEYNVAVNSKKTAMYFILKPVDGEFDDLKKEVDTYINTLKKDVKEQLTYQEHEGYLIYIISEDSKDLMEQVVNTHNPLFSNLTEVDDEALTSRYDIKPEMVDEYLIKVPTMIVNANTYVIIKPSKGNKDEVKEKMDTYMTNLEDEWKTYLPDQYDLVKNRLYEEYEGYLIYIVSNDNDLVLKTIKEN